MYFTWALGEKNAHQSPKWGRQRSRFLSPTVQKPDAFSYNTHKKLQYTVWQRLLKKTFSHNSSNACQRNKHCTKLYKWTIQRQRMSYMQWQKWSMDPLFLHNVHCSLWYVRGYKCLALLPWQPKAASHTIRPLTVFFLPFLFECYTGTIYIISQRGVVSLRNSRLVLNANKRRWHFAMLILEKCYQILTVTPSLTPRLS